MITEFHNHDNGYIMLKVAEIKGVPSEVHLNGMTMYRKSEFHVSILALKHMIPLIAATGKQATESQLVLDFKQLQPRLKLSQCELMQEFRFVARDVRRAVIAMVKVPGIEHLFELLGAKYGLELPVQPVHVTLFTLQPNAGIGIFSQKELLLESTVVDLSGISVSLG